MLTCSRESIPKYIDSGLRQLNESADEYIEMINWNKEKWQIRDSQSIIIIMICYNRSISKNNNIILCIKGFWGYYNFALDGLGCFCAISLIATGLIPPPYCNSVFLACSVRAKCLAGWLQHTLLLCLHTLMTMLISRKFWFFFPYNIIAHRVRSPKFRAKWALSTPNLFGLRQVSVLISRRFFSARQLFGVLRIPFLTPPE